MLLLHVGMFGPIDNMLGLDQLCMLSVVGWPLLWIGIKNKKEWILWAEWELVLSEDYWDMWTLLQPKPFQFPLDPVTAWPHSLRTPLMNLWLTDWLRAFTYAVVFTFPSNMGFTTKLYLSISPLSPPF